MKRILMPAAILFCAVAQTVLCFAADPPKTGDNRDTLIYARTDPPGAKVFVNGKELGITPGLFPADAGVATIILELKGHGQVKKEIRIPANGITRIEIELKPQTPPTGHTAGVAVPQPAKRVHLPVARDADKGDAVVLDLASGQMLKVPRDANGKLVQPSTFAAIGKGDLFFEQVLGCLRGGTAMLWDGTQFVHFPAGNPETRGDATGYKLSTVPCRLLVTTAEKRQFDVTIISAANKTGADLEYRELGPHESLAANSSPQTPPDPESAAKAKSQYNLKYLALAMHNYMNAGKSFPHAVSFGQPGQLGHPSLYDTGGVTLPSFGPTPPKPSKIPHSWRIELLLFLDQRSLYDQYRFDEPWDGPNNRKLIDKMPDVFRCPTQPSDSKNASYFLLVGPGTVFENNEAAPLAHIRDGSSATVLIVEAKRDIPWTKPEDIAYDPNKPLPRLGGCFAGGFNAAFADGAVRFLSDSVDERTVRSLITRAGNEPVSLAALNHPPASSAPSRPLSDQNVDETALRDLVAKLVAAATTGDNFPTKNIGPRFQIANNIREASEAKAAGANLSDVQIIRVRDNKAVVATQFADITDRKYTAQNPWCVVYEFEKQGADWLLADIDLESKVRLAAKLQRFGGLAVFPKTVDRTGAIQLANDSLLDESQRVFRDWTELSFARVFDASALQSLSAAEKAEKEEQWLKELSTLQFRATIPAINGLLALQSKKAIPGLLKIATDRNEGDCRHRWMAIRALGLLGDPVAIPELFDLVYFPNQNTHFWAQISLVRLTGQNFGRDAAAWKQWWRKQGGKPLVSDETVAWTKDPKYLDAKWQIEQDREFIEVLKQRLAHAPAAGTAQAATIPTIVSTTPTVGAVDVDPATTEIRVTFSEPMAGGFSWTGGGPDYPPLANRPHWTADRKTCILPVKLEAAHYYRVGINSKSFQNFRSAAGVPARPSAIYFTTKGASDEAKAKLEKPQIVSMSPANGAKDVDPATTELRVTFNVPMAGGFSWTGSGPNHPEVTGRPHWTDDHKTCILPVKLKPNWDYHLGINSPSHKNFQSASGIPFEPIRYQFSTRAASPEANGTPQAAVRISLPNPRNAASFVLDLAGRQLVALPQYADGKFLDPSKLTKSDKGDLFYHEREFSCLRGSTAKQWDDAGKRFVLLPPRSNGRNKTLTEYPLPSVPGRLLITTAEKKHFDVSVLSVTKEGTLNVEYRPADPELVKKSSVPPSDRREAFLPNVHDSTKGVAVILDLATGQMLSDPRDDKGYKQFDNGGKGDLTLDEGLICLRGARAEKWDGKQVGDLLILTAGDNGRRFREYKLPDLPCRLLITTAEHKRFDVTVFFYADDNDGTYLEYKELPLVSAATTSPRPVRYGNLIAVLVAANATAKGLELLQTATQVDEPQSTGQNPSKPSDAFTAELIPTAAKASVPRIVSISPAVGADNVDPATSEIVVTFSQNMSEGFSWTGGGPDYPPIPEGKGPFWRAPRTCVLPVKLEAGRYYRVGINSKSYQNFRSATGVPVRPTAVYFVTKGATDEVKSRLLKPKVVSMTPANNAKKVDPGTKELRITFNVPMGGGFSWTGGGPNYPKTTGRPTWSEDRKTCILPVELQPNWNYQLGLNSPSHNNFQSESGIPLEPVRYRFSTSGAAKSETPETEDSP